MALRISSSHCRATVWPGMVVVVLVVVEVVVMLVVLTVVGGTLLVVVVLAGMVSLVVVVVGGGSRTQTHSLQALPAGQPPVPVSHCSPRSGSMKPSPQREAVAVNGARTPERGARSVPVRVVHAVSTCAESRTTPRNPSQCFHRARRAKVPLCRSAWTRTGVQKAPKETLLPSRRTGPCESIVSPATIGAASMNPIPSHGNGAPAPAGAADHRSRGRNTGTSRGMGGQDPVSTVGLPWLYP